jgi:hypothetical protein
VSLEDVKENPMVRHECAEALGKAFSSSVGMSTINQSTVSFCFRYFAYLTSLASKAF